MIAALLFSLALQDEPRFTMAAEPGDKVRAELFEVDGGLTDDLRRRLLGNAVVRDEGSQAFAWGRARLIGSRHPDGSLIVLSDAPGHQTLGDRVCRVSGMPAATPESLVRAARWCASFFDPPVIHYRAPPVPLPPAGD